MKPVKENGSIGLNDMLKAEIERPVLSELESLKKQKKAFERLLLASKAIKEDLLLRARISAVDDDIVVSVGASVWEEFKKAIDGVENV